MGWDAYFWEDGLSSCQLSVVSYQLSVKKVLLCHIFTSAENAKRFLNPPLIPMRRKYGLRLAMITMKKAKQCVGIA